MGDGPSAGAALADRRADPFRQVDADQRPGRGSSPQPVALVGIDCKGGMELSLYEPRLSALATNRAQAVKLLRALVDLTLDRMDGLPCGPRTERVGPAGERTSGPVVVIVDELAELFLVASRGREGRGAGAATALIRLAQLGAALGVFLVVAGQRVGSDLGPGVTALGRNSAAGYVTASPTPARQRWPSVTSTRTPSRGSGHHPEQAGTAVLASADGWDRARSHLVPETEAEAIAAECAHLTPYVPELAEAVGAAPAGPSLHIERLDSDE